MSQSHQKSARVILSAVFVSISIILFQNCGKKGGTVGSSSSDPSPAGNPGSPLPLPAGPISIEIRTGSGLGAPLASGSLDPEKTYYTQLTNVGMQGFACAEVKEFNEGACREAGALQPLSSDWHSLVGSDTVELGSKPGEHAYGESVTLYASRERLGQAQTYTYRVKSPSEMTTTAPVGSYVWSSSDMAGKNRIRRVNTETDAVIYSHAVNIGDSSGKASICQEIYYGGNVPETPCFDENGNEKEGMWATKDLYLTSGDDFFQNKTLIKGSVYRYWNEDVVEKWIPKTATCIKGYFKSNGKVVAVAPLNINEGNCPE